MEDGVADAAALLLTVVVEQTEGVAAEGDDGDEVAGGEQRHTQVAKTPDEVEGGEGAEEHHDTGREEAVEGDD